MFIPPSTALIGSQLSGSIDFEASNSECLESSDSFVFVTSAFTMEVWMKLESLPGIEYYFMGFGPGNGVSCRVLSTGALRPVINGTSSASMETNAGVVSVGTWAHVALVYSSGNFYWYVDGTMVKGPFTAGVSWSTGGKLVLGTRYSGSTYRTFDGKLSLARWSNVVRYSSTFTPSAEYSNDASTVAFVSSFDAGASYREAATGSALVASSGGNTPTADSEVPS